MKRIPKQPQQNKLRVCIKFLSRYLRTKDPNTVFALEEGIDSTTISKWLRGRDGKPGICPEWRSMSDMVLRKWCKDARARLRKMPAPTPRQKPIPSLVRVPSKEESVQEALATIREQLDRLDILLHRPRLLKVK